MKTFHLLVLWCASILTICPVVARSCYYPDGGLASGHTVCNSTTTEPVSCCGGYARCMESGLCYDTGLLYRGSCTDPTFKDPACTPYCRESGTHGTIPVVPRQWASSARKISDIGWCCGFPLANGSCPDGATIKVQAGDTISRVPISEPAKCKGNHDVAIGVGLGIPFLLAVVALLALWMLERKKRQREVWTQPVAAKVKENPIPYSFYEPSESPGFTPWPDSIKPQVESSAISNQQASTISPISNSRISEVDGTPKLSELPEN